MNKRISLLITFSILCITLLQSQPRIWNMKSIEDARISNSEAAKAVIREADKNLSATILTVMDKPLTPPSGNKHDYMSMGRYWWPDPTKADGLPYVRRDGVVNPEIDKLDRIPLSKFTGSLRLTKHAKKQKNIYSASKTAKTLTRTDNRGRKP